MPAQRPEDCDRLFGECLNAGDLEGLMALYEPGCRLVRRDGSVAVGYVEIRTLFGRLLEMQPAVRVAVVKVVSAGDDLALLYNDWSLTATGPDGSPFETSGKAIEVLRRRPNGTWRIAIDDPFARG
jgi:uncharacterized protein (TIGR02246 family)